ncbi:sulfurtransferase complex subunit TusD [Parashewanella curva]|uniref:Sulfurtransferase complex subunit TusD n=1 Tax=Parashewanella curva TaxID=2338552 RepID=A0A3L8PV81_9GAMM|nr:sulfurtransferase complex subunit TusD [Parashewanella curva]RLV58669.1 sulfurtransferase complex subunit TusD [Parashewanella curva]
MSKFIIQVTCSAYGDSASYRALAAAKAVIDSGHELTKIFFYRDGVSHANALLCPASDEFNIYLRWKQLAAQYDIPLICCVSAALRRGVVAEQEANEEGLIGFNAMLPFTMAGLGELITGIKTADRVITF